MQCPAFASRPLSFRALLRGEDSCSDCVLAPWSRVLETLTGFQLFKKFPAFNGTRRFTTAFTSARHLSQSSTTSIQSMPPPPIPLPEDPSSYYIPISLSSKWSLSLRFPHQNPVYTSPLPHTYHMPHPSHSSGFDHPNNIW